MPREKRNATKISFLIENDILKKLDEFCKRTGRTKTKVIEMAILMFLEKHKDEK